MFPDFINRNLKGAIEKILSDRMTRVAAFIILLLILLAIFGPLLAPHGATDQHHDPETGELLRAEPPSADHPLGTTERGEDVMSQVMIGALPTMITGIIGGAFIIAIGMTVGTVAGYKGGKVEGLLMRLTDFTFSVPLLPFAILLVAFFGSGIYMTIFVIGIILWRGSARVLRSQVLQIKERPYVKSAKATGAGDIHIMLRHIAPNIASMAILFYALGAGAAILVQANLAFLGMTSPFVPSWGVMVRNVYNAGAIASAPWWSLPPGLLISITVLALILLGRGYEGSGSELPPATS